MKKNVEYHVVKLFKDKYFVAFLIVKKFIKLTEWLTSLSKLKKILAVTSLAWKSDPRDTCINPGQKATLSYNVQVSAKYHLNRCISSF